MLSGIPFSLLSPSQVGLSLEVAETGKSYSANARIKALAFAKASGLLTLADDSGLEVDALNGDPGIFSARYAGQGASDTQRVIRLLSKLNGVTFEQRTARFRCAIAIASPKGDLRLCSGSCRGLIALAPRGENGFGYDPIFFFPKLHLTMAELSSETKNRISHRARATSRARQLLFGIGDKELSTKT